MPVVLEESTGISAPQTFTTLTLEQKLDRFAEVAVRIGLNLAEGQELLISAPIEALPLVRRITEHAYRAGALLVTTFYADDPAILSRYRYAQDASFDYAPLWLHNGIAAAFKANAARIAITGADPNLLAGQDPARLARTNVANSRAAKPAMESITRHEINWSIVACATPAWAKLVFPGDPVEVAVEKLWEAIFTASRITGDDPVADWRDHTAHLKFRVDQLNNKRFHSLASAVREPI